MKKRCGWLVVWSWDGTRWVVDCPEIARAATKNGHTAEPIVIYGQGAWGNCGCPSR